MTAPTASGVQLEAVPFSVACLGRFFGCWAPLELRRLRSQAWTESSLPCGERHKTPVLLQDLVALGSAPEELEQTRQCCALPDLRSPARLFGCLDVIEGAMLVGI